MTPRTKKLIGAIVTLIWLPIYALIAAGVGMHLAHAMPHAPWFVLLLYYALAGTLWIVPVGLMFPWMYREPAKNPPSP
jgi:hypothetical protein